MAQKKLVRWCVAIGVLATAVGALVVATAPTPTAPASAAGGPTRMAFVADNRGIDGFVDVLKAMNALPDKVQAVVLPGDIDPPDVTRRQIDEVLGKKMPWYVALGNHDLDDTKWLSEDFRQRVKPGNATVKPGPKGTAETTYSFDLGPVHIVVLDEYWDGREEQGMRMGRSEVLPEIRAWAAKDLAASQQPWKLVVGHEPAYPTPDQDHGDARHVGDSLDAFPESRDAFWKMLEDQKATAYLCGHTHRYSRIQPPGSQVWQIDVGQARGDTSWEYDAFVILTATETELNVQTYRNLKKQGQFTVTDRMTLKKEPATQPQQKTPATTPAPSAPAPAGR